MTRPLLALLLAIVASGCDASTTSAAPAPDAGTDAEVPPTSEPVETTDGGADESCRAITCPIDTECSGGACYSVTPERQDPPPPGARPCDVAAPWGAPVGVRALNVVPSAGGARVTSDLLGVWFHATPAGARRQIHFASRATPTNAFGAPAVVPGLGAPGDADVLGHPSLSPDGLTLWFDSNRTGAYQIYAATRPSPTSPFGAPQRVAALVDAKNTSQPYVQGDGSTVYFVSRREGPQALGETDVYRAPVLGPGIAGAIEHVPELSSAAVESVPVVAYDGLTIWFARAVTATATTTRFAIFSASRAAVTAPFGRPGRVAELASTRNDVPTWISSDGCLLYLSSDRAGEGYKTYIARRPR